MKMYEYILILVILLHLENISVYSKQFDSNKPSVGIIGGGIGGTAVAYFLENSLKENISVYLYEPGEIGGRLSLSSDFSQSFETGGSIIHPDNQYLESFTKKFGLKKLHMCQNYFGIFDGKDFSFYETKWNFINILKGLYRYGFDIFKLRSLIHEMLTKFSKIYNEQKNGKSFKTVDSLLSSMDLKFPALSTVSLRSYLKQANFGEMIIDEVCTACTRANYGQSPSIHAFVGMVSLAAANSGLWSIDGGNKRIPEELLKHSNAHRMHQRVTKVELIKNAKDKKDHSKMFRVWSVSTSDENSNNSVENYYDYDAVALATPLTKDTSSIVFENFPKPVEILGSYERIFCTLVQGKLNQTTFKYNEIGVVIEEVLTDNLELPYNSVGRQYPVYKDGCSFSDYKVFKVFSPKNLTTEVLSFLFEVVENVEVVNWLAYPHYGSEELFSDFEIFPGLYYNNAIEKAASAMEMSVISAKNTALLIEDFFRNNNPSEEWKAKDEL